MKLFGKSLLYILLSVLIGLFLLMAAYMIPTDRMEENCRESVPVFQEEGYAPVEWYSIRALDNFGDALMLETAAYPGDEPLLERTIASYRLGVTPEDPEHTVFAITGTKTIEAVSSFIAIHTGTVDTSIARESYARYWHGYLVVLKPLLTFFNYEQIRNINTVVQYLLLLIIAKLLLKKCPYGLVPFVIMNFFLAPTSIGKCIHFFCVYCVALFTTLVLLWNPGGKLNRENVWKLFLFTGIATTYFDLFLLPTLSLTIPLCILCMQISGDGTWKDNMLTLIRCGFAWSLGFAGMWAGKWLIGLALQGKTFWYLLTDVIVQWSDLGAAVSSGIDLVGRIGTLKKLWTVLFNNVHINCLTLIWAGVLGFGLLKGRKALVPRNYADAALFLVPALIPFAWGLVINNHSSAHYWATFRIMAPCVFAFLSAVGMLEFERSGGLEGPGEQRPA